MFCAKCGRLPDSSKSCGETSIAEILPCKSTLVAVSIFSPRVSRDLTPNLKRDRATDAILQLFLVHFTLFALADAYGTKSAIPAWIRII